MHLDSLLSKLFKITALIGTDQIMNDLGGDMSNFVIESFQKTQFLITTNNLDNLVFPCFRQIIS
jgi:hypothetical protein